MPCPHCQSAATTERPDATEFVTAMQAAVTVTDAVATGCPDNPNNASARAALGGRFFGGGANA
jgi:hypothetical protein